MTFLDYHTHHFDDDKEVLSVVNYFPEKVCTEHFFSVGIHPCYIREDVVNEDLKIIEQLTQHPNCFAIGECGLDRNSPFPMEFQTEIFKQQIFLSEKYQKPLTIHCVKAYGEIISLKKALNPQQNWVLHGFRKNEQVANSLLNHGIKLSFGKALLYDEKLQNVFRKIPEDCYFLETDDAEISIREIYHKAEELRKTDAK